MITKPKASKFRIRRSEPTDAPNRATAKSNVQPLRETDALFDDQDDGFGDTVFPTAGKAAQNTAEAKASEAKTGEVTSAREVTTEKQVEEIRREGLTGRQLRTARRVAQRNGIDATSDFEAVLLLRRKGIDPFQRANMLELVVADSGDHVPARADGGRLPQTTRPGATPAKPMPSLETISEEQRLRDIQRIQADLARRRRRRSILLAARLAFFIGLPTFLAGFYYYRIATPFYAAKAAFVINKANSGGGGGSPLASFFSGTSFASSQDSINAQDYLMSRSAFDKLNREHGFRKLMSGPNIDPMQRISPKASNDAAYHVYQRDVKVGYDPNEGVVRLEVSTPNPQKSVEFATALISYAQQQVDGMTKQMRDDQMKGAQQSYNDAEAKLQAANKRVLDLQRKFNVMSGDAEASMIASRITALNTQLDQDQLNLMQMQSAPNPSQGRIAPLKQRIADTERQVKLLRSRLTKNDGSGESLAMIQGQLAEAKANVQTRQMMLSQALQALESARVTANEQTRYFSVGVQPVAPDTPSYPRAFEDTIVAFLIFCGLYLMLSMTASILREQVSA